MVPTMEAQRVLIVEDDLATLFVMRRLFTQRGWKVSQCKTVAATLDQLDPPPDWIILDLGLADGDGEDVLRHVRQAGIPSRVAVVSAGLDPHRIQGLKPLKPDLLLAKPISFDALLDACAGPFPPSS